MSETAIGVLPHGRKAAVLSAIALLLVPGTTMSADDSNGADSAAAAHSYSVGPFKLSLGPQSDGYFGATLKGDKSFLFAEFSALPHPKDAPPADSLKWFSYGNVDVTLDSGWSSAPAANNNASVALKPTATVGLVLVSPKAPKTLTPDQQAVCNQFSDDLGSAINSGEGAKQKQITLAFKKAGCDTLEDPYHDIVALSLYPSFEYRFGHFTQNGQQYQANQSVIGGGARVFLPWRLNEWWASWPFVSATYYHVKDNSGSTIPVPDGLKADYISAEAKVEVLLPVKIASRSKALELSFDLTGSKATTGATKSWQFLHNIQLLANLGNSWKPALTYREGKDRGLSYDKQVILGIAAEFL